ncbi:MobA/MobL family protein, partial [Escherichia coli]|uniref:MobA/MobL family protein n=1 Tax=Escherichia coli TaxID=562 RepID=UPI003EDFB8FE
ALLVSFHAELLSFGNASIMSRSVYEVALSGSPIFRRSATRRASWADHANRALANAGYQEEIDHRSYERQGLEKTPGIHLGKS